MVFSGVSSGVTRREHGSEVVTREQLYEQVWSEPMATLAPKYGMSDVGLAKICRKLRVPVPGRGYWRQKEVGQKVRRPVLPKLPAAASSDMREVRLRRPTPGATGSEAVGPVADQQRFEAQIENRIVVPAILDDPHALVARSVGTLRRAKHDYQGYLHPPKTSGCLGVRVTLDSVDRAMCIYDALLKALDLRGYQPSIRQGEEAGTIVKVGQEDVSVTIEEKLERVTRDDSGVRRPSRFTSERDWKPTGRLVLRWDHAYLGGIRTSWADGKKQRVEDCLNDFIVGLVTVAEQLKANRLQREAWEKERREAEARRAEEARRREEEAGRVRALEAAIAAWQRTTAIREYAAELRLKAEAAGVLEQNAALAAWLAWAVAYADRIDPFLPEPSVPQDPGRSDRYGYRQGSLAPEYP
jgi:hypothetical protein